MVIWVLKYMSGVNSINTFNLKYFTNGRSRVFPYEYHYFVIRNLSFALFKYFEEFPKKLLSNTSFRQHKTNIQNIPDLIYYPLLFMQTNKSVPSFIVFDGGNLLGMLGYLNDHQEYLIMVIYVLVAIFKRYKKPFSILCSRQEKSDLCFVSTHRLRSAWFFSFRSYFTNSSN